MKKKTKKTSNKPEEQPSLSEYSTAAFSLAFLAILLAELVGTRLQLWRSFGSISTNVFVYPSLVMYRSALIPLSTLIFLTNLTGVFGRGTTLYKLGSFLGMAAALCLCFSVTFLTTTQFNQVVQSYFYLLFFTLGYASILVIKAACGEGLTAGLLVAGTAVFCLIVYSAGQFYDSTVIANSVLQHCLIAHLFFLFNGRTHAILGSED